jgi:hypothetical protein
MKFPKLITLGHIAEHTAIQMISTAGWAVEHMYEGERVLVRMVRESKRITVYPKDIKLPAKIKKKLKETLYTKDIKKDFILECVYCNIAQKPTLYVYDVITSNRSLEYYDRKKALMRLANKNEWYGDCCIRYVNSFMKTDSKERVWRLLKREGLKSLIFKKITGKYNTKEEVAYSYTKRKRRKTKKGEKDGQKEPK